VAKHLLRTAFEGWLPGEVLWRDKVQFGDGSGVGDVLRERMAGTVSEAELRRLREVAPVPLRDAEEAAYYRLFAEHHGPGSAAQVAQFATTSEPT
jgi:asparagine synthase (glutamine-hydrolysing)